jgi:hypothetical protein
MLGNPKVGIFQVPATTAAQAALHGFNVPR